MARAWTTALRWLLLAALRTNHAHTACGPCETRVVVATTINAVRTASLLVPSAAALRVALRVYHENSADARAGHRGFRAADELPRCVIREATCFRDYDLHVLYPWLEAFAARGDEPGGAGRSSSVFGLAYDNSMRRARRGALPKHAKGLTVKAHFIFRKVAALRHAVEAAAADAGTDLAVWVDADVELVRPLDDAAFLAFALKHDVATIHRYVVPNAADATGCGSAAAYFDPASAPRALPDTGFVTFDATSTRALDFVRAWSGYYGTTHAARSRCLNDICVYDRVLAPTDHPDGPAAADGLAAGLAAGAPSAYGGVAAVAASLLPPDLAARADPVAALDAWVRDYVYGGRRAALREGWYALCAEAWAPALAGRADGRRDRHQLDGGAALSAAAIAAKYRVDLGRAHPCPSATNSTSPFHLFEYALHAKGGANKTDWRRADDEASPAAPAAAPRARPRALASRPESAVGRWRGFRRESLSHPFDATRVNLGGALRAARDTRLPVGAVLEASRAFGAVPFYDALEARNATLGYAASGPAVGGRSTLGLPPPRACGLDRDAVALQIDWLRNGACDCDGGAAWRMEGTIGLGGELSALLKPLAAAADEKRTFRTPALDRVGCASGDLTCLGLRPLDRCPASAPKTSESARRYSRAAAPRIPARHRGRGLFWWTSQAAAFLLRPDDATLERVWRTMDALGWRSRGPVLGVHVRRGDTCLKGGRDELRKHKGRVCDGLPAYVDRARRMISRYGYRAVYLATDDADVLANATAGDAFGVPVLVANRGVDRARLYGQGYYNKVLRAMGDAAAADDAAALLDDVFLLAAADGFVGKFTSNVARLAFALGNAWKGGDCVAPFDSLDATWCADFGRLTGDSVNGKFLC